MTIRSDMQNRADIYRQFTYQCKNCGHKMLMDYTMDSRICSWCGSIIYKDEKRYFKDKLRQHLNKKED